MYCPTTNWPGSQWYSPLKSVTQANWKVANTYTISSYNSPKYLIRFREKYAYLGAAQGTGHRVKLSLWDGGAAVGMDGMQDSLANLGANPSNYAINHDLLGVNAVYLDGSAKWWAINSLRANALVERNTFSDGGGHSGCFNFWKAISPEFDITQ